MSTRGTEAEGLGKAATDGRGEDGVAGADGTAPEELAGAAEVAAGVKTVAGDVAVALDVAGAAGVATGDAGGEGGNSFAGVPDAEAVGAGADGVPV